MIQSQSNKKLQITCFCLFQFDSILNEQKQKRDKEHLYCLSLLSCPSPNPVRSAIKVITVC